MAEATVTEVPFSEFLRKQKHVFIGGKIKGFIVDEINGIDIDTKLDFKSISNLCLDFKSFSNLCCKQRL